jgi:D-2-hydroxyacid dehydrogenase (NADP+)
VVTQTERELKTFLIRIDFPQPALERLRATFPDIDFITKEDSGYASALSQADALLTWGLSEEEIEAASRLKWVQWIGAGVDDAPLQELANRSISLTKNRGVHAENISEHVLALMLAFARNLPYLYRSQLDHTWSDVKGRKGTFELAGSRLLVVGGGAIGTALERKASALGMATQVARRARSADGQPSSMEAFRAHLAEMLPHADHLAFCLPWTPLTHQLMNSELFTSTKHGAYVYNIGRGAVIETDALVSALRAGHLGGAGLDVTDPEPLPPEHPLWDFPNVIITAHTSGATPRYWERGTDILIENIGRFRSGQPLNNLVNFNEGY